MNLVIIGAGYVGLVTGACFSEMGNKVICVDSNEVKVKQLKQAVMPIYEPGLKELVASNTASGRLSFTTSVKEALLDAEMAFIAVGTPSQEDGSADLQHVLDVANEIGNHISSDVLIVDKSTVPVGTAEKVSKTIGDAIKRRRLDIKFEVISNPEFLKEGVAIEDFMRPDRVIVGAVSEYSQETMRKLYAPFVHNHERIIFMSPRDAEMTKYVANSMLATKISFMNEIANLCESVEVDVENVRLGIGSDTRIGYSFIYPGVGYGGSCFPKDVRALIHVAAEHDNDLSILKAVSLANEKQKSRLGNKIKTRFGNNLTGFKCAIWGLAFKPGTDDVRDAPSLVLIKSLVEAGATVTLYDPSAMETARSQLPNHYIENNRAIFAADCYETLEQADCLALMTEWKPFRNPDFRLIKDLMKNPVIFDGRNQYDPLLLRQLGFEYFGIGR